jgi:dolichol-phosphate mannosyltransferase
MKIAVIIPTYNERENIRSLLDRLLAVTKPLAHHQCTFIVVDDTSPDGTAQVVKAYRKTHPNTVLISGKKEGLGKALLRGMTYAIDDLGADAIAQIDADLSHDPTAFGKFVSALDNGSDFVIGSRYITGGSIPSNWGLHRKIYSVLGNAVVRYGLGFSSVHDWTGGYRLYRASYAKRLREQMNKYRGYVFQIAFLYKSILLGADVAEIPIHFSDRQFGHSKIAPSEYIRDVLTFVFRQRVKRAIYGPFLKFCVVGSIGFAINTIILEVLVTLGMHPAWGSAVGAECAIVSNFLLNNNWTFGTKKIAGIRLIRKFFQFNVTSLGAIFLQAGTVLVGTHLFGIQQYRWFYVPGVGFGLLWNYAMYSRVIWRQKR